MTPDDDRPLVEIMADALAEMESYRPPPMMLVADTNGCGGYWLNVIPASAPRPETPPGLQYPRKGPAPFRWWRW